jgi:formate dehydrogenase maturation protein FdhE
VSSLAGVNRSWKRCIRRADQLATAEGSTRRLLTFYAGLLRCQAAIAEGLVTRTPSGSMTQDLAAVAGPRQALLRDVIDHGPERDAIDDLLAYWETRSDRQFFAKAILQPYAQWLTDAGVPLPGERPRHDNRCPRCGGAPQLSVLEEAAAGDGGGRRLQCATCLTLWPFRRVLCPSCGEEDEHQLSYFRTPEFDHVRVDVCLRCRRYLKSIDLGRLGLAVPLVDEVASAALDLWAREQRYEKIELNLVGL